MTEEQHREAAASQEAIGASEDIFLPHLKQGTKIRMTEDRIAEIVANPRDGVWVVVRYLSYPGDPSKVGTEDLCFVADALGIVP